MSDSKASKAKEAVEFVAGSVKSNDALGALRHVVDATSEYLKLREEHQQKRAELDAYATLETERIRAAERVLTEYFSQVFTERASNFDRMWERLDEAAKAGDAAAVSETLQSILDLAQKSPLAGMENLGHLRKALNDPDHVWEL